jgi:hypothetical protein
VFTGSIKTPTIDELTSIAGSKGGKFKRHSKKNIAARMYYVDTGFTYSHEDEDFFHLACSFGLHEDGRSPEEKLAAITEYYNQFKSIRGYGTKPSTLAYNLHGFYRCFVSGHLNINTYERENKSAKHVRERITHRLGLAEAFARVASIGVATSGIYEHFPEERRNDPAAIVDSIHGYPLLSKDNPDESQSEIQRSINIRRALGLQYFAHKFGSIRPQYQPASQPASQ